MAPVDQNWTSFQNIHDGDHAKRIQRVLDKTNFPRLCSRAVELRKQEEDVPDTLTCSVDTAKFTSGWCNVVIALTFSDTAQWVARIMLSRGRRNEEDTSISLLSEISTMKLIRRKTTIPVPRVFGYCTTRSDIGYPYLMMEALPGNVLGSSMGFAVPDERKGAFAAQLATYVYELSTLQFSKIGRISYSSEFDEVELLPFPIGGSLVGPLSTSLEYFYLYRKGQTKAILKSRRGDKEWEAACWLLEKSLTAVVTEEHVYGPFPLCHMDFHSGNILVDEDYNITGIIDWSHSQSMPIERFAMIPELIYPSIAPEETKQALGGLRGMFLDALERVERERGGPPSGIPLHQLFASPRSEVVCRCTCSYPWRAIIDAWLIVPLLYGENATWEDFQKFYNERSV